MEKNTKPPIKTPSDRKAPTQIKGTITPEVQKKEPEK